jgi:hypothetical protein
MRHRREQNHHDTSEKPDIQIYVDQTAIPVKVAGDWTLGTNMVASSGSLVLTASPDAEVAKRNIPGVLDALLYKVTIVVDSIDAGELDVVFGGVAIGSLDAAATYTFWVRPTGGNELTITVDNAASDITGTISSLIIEAQDPIELDRIPVI